MITRAEYGAIRPITRRAETAIAREKHRTLYRVMDHTSPRYERDPLHWAADLDLTCISPWNSLEAHKRAGTLITPRHVIFAQHFPLPNGTEIRFVDSTDTIHTRTVSNTAQILTTDIRVGVLDSDLPSTIRFAKILPSNWATYFPTASEPNLAIPVLATDQDENLLYMETRQLHYLYGGVRYVSLKRADELVRTQFAALHEQFITGDSGSAAFFVFNREPVLAGCVYGSDSQTRFVLPSPHHYAADINTALTTLGGGYQLTTFDLADTWDSTLNDGDAWLGPLTTFAMGHPSQYLLLQGLACKRRPVPPPALRI